MIKNKELKVISDSLYRRRDYAEKHLLQRAYKNAVLHLALLYPEDKDELMKLHFKESDKKPTKNGKYKARSFASKAKPIKKTEKPCDGCITDAEKQAQESNETSGGIKKRVSKQKHTSTHKASIEKNEAYKRAREEARKESENKGGEVITEDNEEGNKLETKEDISNLTSHKTLPEKVVVAGGNLIKLRDCNRPRDILKYFKSKCKEGEKVTERMSEYIEVAQIQTSAQTPIGLATAILNHLKADK